MVFHIISKNKIISLPSVKSSHYRGYKPPKTDYEFTKSIVHDLQYNLNLFTLVGDAKKIKDLNLSYNTSNWKLIHSAAYNGHIDLVRYLISKNIDINQVTKDGATPLYLASQKGHHELVQLLLENKAKASIPSNNWLPIHIAAANNHSEVITVLIKFVPQMINVLLKPNNKSPLYLAANEGGVDAVKTLLKLNADTNLADNNGWSSIHAASYNGHDKCVQVLLKKIKDPNIKTRDGETSVYLASAKNQALALKQLLDHKANPFLGKNDTWTPLHQVVELKHDECFNLLMEAMNGKEINKTITNNRTALFLATIFDNPVAINRLLMKDANPNIGNEVGETPLMIASLLGFKECFLALLKHPKTQINPINRSEGTSALDICFIKNRLDFAKSLLKKGAHAENRHGKNRETNAHMAVKNGNLEALKLLYEFHVNLFIKTKDGKTAEDYVRELIKTNPKDKHKYQPCLDFLLTKKNKSVFTPVQIKVKKAKSAQKKTPPKIFKPQVPISN